MSSNKSIPRGRPRRRRRRNRATPTKKERRAYEAHLNRVIAHLWTNSNLPEVRAMAALQDVRDELRRLRAESVTQYRIEYRRLILAFTNQGEAAVWREGHLPTTQLAAPRLDATAREGYDRCLFAVLDSAGLFNPRFPFEHLDYQILVAHLLLAEKEIDDARDLEDPFPWPWHVERDTGRPLHVREDLGIREAEHAIAGRIGRALSALYVPPIVFPPTRAAAERRAEKRVARLRLGARANELYPRLSLDDILHDPEFIALQGPAHTQITQPQAVRRLIQWYRRESNVQAKRGRPRSR